MPRLWTQAMMKIGPRRAMTPPSRDGRGIKTLVRTRAERLQPGEGIKVTFDTNEQAIKWWRSSNPNYRRSGYTLRRRDNHVYIYKD